MTAGLGHMLGNKTSRAGILNLAHEKSIKAATLSTYDVTHLIDHLPRRYILTKP